MLDNFWGAIGPPAPLPGRDELYFTFLVLNFTTHFAPLNIMLFEQAGLELLLIFLSDQYGVHENV